MQKKLLTVEEASEMLGLKRTQVYALIMRGELASVKIGRARRVPIWVLDHFIEEQLAALGHPVSSL